MSKEEQEKRGKGGGKKEKSHMGTYKIPCQKSTVFGLVISLSSIERYWP